MKNCKTNHKVFVTHIKKYSLKIYFLSNRENIIIVNINYFRRINLHTPTLKRFFFRRIFSFSFLFSYYSCNELPEETKEGNEKHGKGNVISNMKGIWQSRKNSSLSFYTQCLSESKRRKIFCTPVIFKLCFSDKSSAICQYRF